MLRQGLKEHWAMQSIKAPFFPPRILESKMTREKNMAVTAYLTHAGDAGDADDGEVVSVIIIFITFFGSH